MKYISTRGKIEPISFSEAVMMGLANDGGLLLPESIPKCIHNLDEWRKLSYPDLAYAIISRFVGDDIEKNNLTRLIDNSYSAFTHEETLLPVIPIDDLFMMELFHGPTLAFKDIALQLLGNLFEYILKRDDRSLNILGATSGDTGSAAIYGIRNKKNINIFILHPHKKVSPVQERQMTTVLDDNVFNIAIEGSFDDGQRIIKNLFNDQQFKAKYQLGAVNSVNWARVAAQIVYYFYGAFRVAEMTGESTVRVCVPTGNFGNIFAGYMAVKMGAPISQLILATNENDILARFFSSGIYRQSPVKTTYSPSMDIQVASNFERYLFYLLGEDSSQLCRVMDDFGRTGCIQISLPIGKNQVDPFISTASASNEETLNTIRKVYNHADYLLDPHTAVGVTVCGKLEANQEPTLCLATAHPAKFGGAIKDALGYDAAQHERIDQLHNLPTRCITLPADEKAIRSFIEQAILAE